MSGSGAAAAEFSLAMEATELRLGLPGGTNGRSSPGKRSFNDVGDLKLELLTAGHDSVTGGSKSVEVAATVSGNSDKPRAPKAQVVGWPPVRAYRKNVLSTPADKGKKAQEVEAGSGSNPSAGSVLVKVSMDGAPYLRKVDLKMFGGYQELSAALQSMFSSFTPGKNGGKEIDLVTGMEFVPTYEDKDGDCMLVGDVPWEMFVESCKRLRIMKGSEATGLAPRVKNSAGNKS